MKEKKVVTIVSLLIIIVICVMFIILQGTKINSYKEDINSYKEEINRLENKEDDKKEEEDKYYDCSFTQTYRVVNLLDGYIAEVPERSYVIVDKFQSHGAYAHPILTNLKEDLEINKYYEFTYHIKGTGVINDLNDVVSHITDKSLSEDIPEGMLRVNLSIKETNKEGLEQVQENICQYE